MFSCLSSVSGGGGGWHVLKFWAFLQPCVLIEKVLVKRVYVFFKESWLLEQYKLLLIFFL